MQVSDDTERRRVFKLNAASRWRSVRVAAPGPGTIFLVLDGRESETAQIWTGAKKSVGKRRGLAKR